MNQKTASPPFSLLVKPASADCNLRCDYCFYLDKSALYPETRRHRMSDAVLEQMISGYMATEQPVYAFAWQGGEPALMGADFFRRVVDLQKKYGRPGCLVSNGLQTNGTLIDDEMAALFSEYEFLVGVSIDGPPDIHDVYRRGSSGRGSHQDVLRGIALLNRHRVEFNALVLVHAVNVDRAAEIYSYLIELGILHHQYIPCITFADGGSLQPYAVTGKQWGDFLCDLYDRWYVQDTRRVSIRLFDAILNHMVDWRYTMCTMAGRCNHYVVIEHNGDVYPCDFFVEPNRRLGNLTETLLPELVTSSMYDTFGRQKADWNQRCVRCAYLRFCAGDCLKHRFQSSNNPRSISVLCEGWRAFFSHSLDGFQQLAVTYLNEYRQNLPTDRHPRYQVLPSLTLTRGAPCFCGSEKPFANCHGRGKRKRWTAVKTTRSR